MRKLLTGFALGVAFLPILGLIAIHLGLCPVRATATPPAWEHRLAASALRASLARDAVHVASPVPAGDEDLLAGMKLYRNDCAGCHGDFGHPSVWGTAGFYPRVPQFSEQPSPLTPGQMYLVVKRGIRYSGMGAWDRLLADEDIWRVVSFLSRLNALPPSVDAAWRGKTRVGSGGA
jgi:thiosulfate dehydrogenase